MDLSDIEIWAKVGELDRANLKEGQNAMIQLDAVPDQRFRATIKALSGTASSDVFSGDPSKKFDVVFSVDMRQLLSGLGMKPADIERIMETAATNAKKAANSPTFGQPAPDDAGGGGGRGQRGQRGQGRARGGDTSGGAAPAAAGDTQGRGANGQGRGRGGDTGGGAAQAAAGDTQGRGANGQGRGQAGGNRFANLSEADRTKMTELRQKMQSAATDEDRAKVQKELQDLMAKNGITMGGRGGNGQGRGAAGEAQGAPGGFVGGRGAGGGGRGGTDLGDPLQMFMARGRGSSPFSDDDRKNAKLPLPPEEDSQVQVLLRPGLLADVEIEVEKIPDVLHVPAQAVFNKDGKYTVFVQGKDGKFTAREVQLIKQSESTMVLSGGVQPGEIIAMSDPTAKKNEKNGDKKGSSTNPMGGMPGGK